MRRSCTDDYYEGSPDFKPDTAHIRYEGQGFASLDAEALGSRRALALAVTIITTTAVLFNLVGTAALTFSDFSNWLSNCGCTSLYKTACLGYSSRISERFVYLSEVSSVIMQKNRSPLVQV